MKKFKKIKVLILSIIFILLSTVKSYGAVVIIKGENTFTNRSISDFYNISKEMKNIGQGLESTNVDVHMATNGEWATVSYFSNSAYGTATVGQNKGIEIDIDGRKYLSTNGNATGIMDWGKTITFTSGLISNYAEMDKSSAVYTNGKSLVDNAGKDRKIDILSSSTSAVSIGKNGWYNSWNYLGNDFKYPYSVRSGLFGFNAGSGLYGVFASGAASTNITFRPVIL